MYLSHGLLVPNVGLGPGDAHVDDEDSHEDGEDGTLLESRESVRRGAVLLQGVRLYFVRVASRPRRVTVDFF